MKTDEVCARPLETFGSHSCLLNFIGSFLVCVPFVPPKQQHKPSNMGGDGRRGQGGDRRLCLFLLPPCRARRRETSCDNQNQEISSMKIAESHLDKPAGLGYTELVRDDGEEYPAEGCPERRGLVKSADSAAGEDHLLIVPCAAR